MVLYLVFKGVPKYEPLGDKGGGGGRLSNRAQTRDHITSDHVAPQEAMH